MKADGFEQSRVFTDLSGLNKLKEAGREDNPEAVKQIAKQFEGMLIKVMMQSMRDATRTLSEDNPFSSDQMKFYEDMMDQQMSLTLTKGEGLGLAKSLTGQLEKYVSETEGLIQNSQVMDSIPLNAAPKELLLDLSSAEGIPLINAKSMHEITAFHNSTPTSSHQSSEFKDSDGSAAQSVERIQLGLSNEAEAEKIVGEIKRTGSVFSSPQQFVDALYPIAKKVAEPAGIDPKLVVAQAALETGWGKYIMSDAEGSSNNLFGIKASNGWAGNKMSIDSLEYENNEPVLKNSDFRKYADFESSVTDYVDFLQNNPRYKAALEQGANPDRFPQELQSAGYATDPNYAQKITRIYNESVIQSASEDKLPKSVSSAVGTVES